MWNQPIDQWTKSADPRAAVTTFHVFANRAEDSTPRPVETMPRTDAEIAEEWTRECLFDCYND